ncbi:hypothetical protein GO755_30635 [Spirosoma sp. HMF4905]|uniref:Uncharacterized protein n=1 Tax=Spirosoma arboris TaxID=2682092 RepID=A0A7K1SKZ5_9BACT|nr:hypothetical protein [Spirosoma arboris]MVM34428.1 hypothetical protein [Spirosoma arboris]
MDASTHMNGLADISLPERLMRAYKRVSPNLRALARRDFCEYHGITDDTFRAKRTGKEGYVATEQECEWMEAYKPEVVHS